MRNERYSMGPRVVRRVPIVSHLFGKEWDSDDVTCTTRLKLSIACDQSIVWLNDRAGRVVQMERGEALEMVALLNREFLLDVLGQTSNKD